MGRYIGREIGMPDAIITSDAARAEVTAELAAEAMGYVGDLTLVPQIYDANVTTLLAVVRSILDDVDTALLVGHNPGFEEVAAALAGIDSYLSRPAQYPLETALYLWATGLKPW